jgi:hypothetical protein
MQDLDRRIQQVKGELNMERVRNEHADGRAWHQSNARIDRLEHDLRYLESLKREVAEVSA